MQTSQLEAVALVGESEIQGTCDERFVAVRDAFAANLNTGKDIGASVALFIDGEPVVDLWGGVLRCHVYQTISPARSPNRSGPTFTSVRDLSTIIACRS
jgi:hypothetical protein